jgi:serine/threonine-protein kinase
MSAAPAPQSETDDRNFLFGMLARQLGFVSPDRLLAAMLIWASDKAKPLGQILAGRGDLSPERLQLLDALVEERLKGHHGGEALPLQLALEQELKRPGDDAQASRATIGDTVAYTGHAAEEPAAGLRYRVLRPFARGGLGEILVAEDLELHREVALKEIQQRFAGDEQSQARFLLEAEVTARLEHPGVVPVHGLGKCADGRPFYAMRLVQGDTLQEAIRKFHEPATPHRNAGERSLALRRLLTRFVAVCNAVAYAHSRGVIHRDLKPANIMLGKYGETLVLDWGLAKVVGRQEAAEKGEQTLHPLSGDVEATRAGSTVGTAAYMSPEQAAGRIDEQGPASDTYSLGATLYALLTGRPPVAGESIAEVLHRVETGDWLPPRRVKADVPGALDAICRKAMALRPQDRYASALELGADVERWLGDEPVGAWKEQAWTRVGRWARRRPVFSAWVGISVAVYIVGIVIGIAARLFTATPTWMLLIMPISLSTMIALAMTASAQAGAILCAAGAFMAGYLSERGARRRQRGVRWARSASANGASCGRCGGLHRAVLVIHVSTAIDIEIDNKLPTDSAQCVRVGADPGNCSGGDVWLAEGHAIARCGDGVPDRGFCRILDWDNPGVKPF